MIEHDINTCSQIYYLLRIRVSRMKYLQHVQKLFHNVLTFPRCLIFQHTFNSGILFNVS